MKKLYKSVMTILFFAVAAFLSGGCSSTPSESDAKRLFETEVIEGFRSPIKLVNFTKTNAQFSEKEGVKIYTLEYEATIEFLEDCVWVGRKNGSRFITSISSARILRQKVIKNNKAGQRELITGEMEFEKMEKGWRGISVVINR